MRSLLLESGRDNETEDISDDVTARVRSSIIASSVSISRGRLASLSGYDSIIRKTFEEVTGRKAGTSIRR